MEPKYNRFILKHLYPWRRRVQFKRFKKWLADATSNLDLTAKKILVVACGPGLEIPFLAKKVGPGGQVNAFDISEEMLTHAQNLIRERQITNARVFLGDARDVVNFPEDAYDYVFVILGLSVIPDYEKTIGLIYRTLRYGGGIIVFDSQTPRGFKKIFTNFYNKVVHAYNRPLVQKLRQKFRQKIHKEYSGDVYFLWRGEKS